MSWPINRTDADLISEFIDDLCSSLKLSRGDFARALGRERTSLQWGRLSNSPATCGHILWHLSRINLPHLGAALILDENQYSYLRKRTKLLLETIYGFDLSEFESVNLPSAIESAEIGLTLFDQRHWQQASTHLEKAWQFFSENPPNSGESHFSMVLRALSQYASLFNHWDGVPESRVITERLLVWLQRVKASDLQGERLRAIATVYVGASITTRLLSPNFL